MKTFIHWQAHLTWSHGGALLLIALIILIVASVRVYRAACRAIQRSRRRAWRDMREVHDSFYQNTKPRSPGREPW